MLEVQSDSGDGRDAPHKPRPRLQRQRSRNPLPRDRPRPPGQAQRRAGEGRTIRCLAILAACLLLLVCAAPAHAYPGYWIRGARCIHYQETRSSWNAGWHIWWTWPTHAPSRQRGGFQIDEGTWDAYAPHGWTRDPARASRAQQLLVAWRIWRANGHRWGGNQWPNTAAACGVR